jgi:integrase
MSKVEKRYSKRLRKYIWGFDAWVGPRTRKVRVRRWCFESKDEAEAVLSQLRLNARADEFGLSRQAPQIFVADLASALEKDQPKTRHQHDTVRCLKDLSALLPHTPLTELTTADIRKIITHYREKGLQDVTIQHHLNVIATAFNRAYEHFSALQKWKKPRFPYIPGASKKARGRVYTPDEAARILQALRNPSLIKRKDAAHSRLLAADMFELALLTARRIGELAGIRKSDIILQTNQLNIRAPKTNEEFQIPLWPRAKEILSVRRAQAGTDSDYVFTGRKGGITRVAHIVDDMLDWACEKAGIPKGRDVTNGVTFHDTRRTSITLMLQAGVDLKTVASIARHSEATMTLLYAQATQESQRAALRVLEDFSVQFLSRKSNQTAESSDLSDTADARKSR